MIVIVIANVLFRKYKLNYDIIRKYFFYKKYNFYICNYIYLKIGFVRKLIYISEPL